MRQLRERAGELFGHWLASQPVGLGWAPKTLLRVFGSLPVSWLGAQDTLARTALQLVATLLSQTRNPEPLTRNKGQTSLLRSKEKAMCPTCRTNKARQKRTRPCGFTIRIDRVV